MQSHIFTLYSFLCPFLLSQTHESGPHFMSPEFADTFPRNTCPLERTTVDLLPQLLGKLLEKEALRPESISVPITCHTLSLTLTRPWHYRFAHSFSYSFFISTTWTLDPWLQGHFLVQCCITLTRKCGGHSMNVCCLYGNMTRPEGNLKKRDLADTMGLGN